MTKIKNSFVVPNEVYALNLDATAIAIYCYLLSIENRKTFSCYPSYKTIGEAVNLSANTVRKCISELVDKGLISTQPTSVFTRDGLKRNGNLLYTIRPIAEAVELHNARQKRKFDAEQVVASAMRNKSSRVRCGSRREAVTMLRASVQLLLNERRRRAIAARVCDVRFTDKQRLRSVSRKRAQQRTLNCVTSTHPMRNDCVQSASQDAHPTRNAPAQSAVTPASQTMITSPPRANSARSIYKQVKERWSQATTSRSQSPATRSFPKICKPPSVSRLREKSAVAVS